jgi:hypothetical protein
LSKEILTISRYWNNPVITAFVTNDEVGVRITLEDFLAALKTELGSITFKISNVNFKALVDQKSKEILEKVKESSIHAVS